MATADVRQRTKLRRAENEVRDAITGILTRSGCRIAEALATEIHQAYTGRGWIPLPDIHCPEHPSIKKPCPLCPRTPEDHDA